MEDTVLEDLSILGAPESIADPYPIYDQLRAKSPLFGYRDFPPGTVPGIDDPQPAWVVLRFDHVSQVAYDHERFSSRDSLQEESSAPTLMLVNHDRPQHTRLRKIAAKVFQPSSIKAFHEEAKVLAAQTMDEFLTPGEPVDVMEDYCAMLPSRIMAALLGVPMERDRDIRRWATAFMLSEDLSPEERQSRNVALLEFFDAFVRDFVANRDAAATCAPLLRAFLDTEVEGEKLSTEEVILFCVTVTVAGAETTSFHLGNIFAVFADESGIWERYQANPSSFDRIFKETLRRHGPPQRLFRVATQDTQVGDALIKRGEWVAVFFGAANHDPAVFPDPKTFDPDRENLSRHMSFGYGIHRCLGAPLAQLELEVTAELLRERFERIERTEPAEWQGVSLLNHGLARNVLKFIPKNQS
ncbi:cytochrome P450 [Altererythrobacter arenosus]|uniref:Cytochrome P450 n=1 Tax=Altererythrobacter arenosus TaxID=3032592 RepID=A0ABY8FN57_9SPHN|nr:cytochrome P450 [Altererythrobacter sp. CAU 1644]WFL76292.1 cytochrome P450 [Altererythrobacter sp. CAU 1644]